MSRKRVENNISYDERNRLYYVTFNYGMDAAGRRVKKTKTYDTHIAASEALRIFEEKKRRHEIVIPTELTVGMWLDRWMEEVVRPNRARSTIYGYENMIKNHIRPALGDTVLQELSPEQIQSYYLQMRQEGLGSNTVHKHHQLLFTALECAVRHEMLNRNPARRVDPPAKEPPRHAFYNTEQLRTLFLVVRGEPLEPAVKLAGYLGLRRSEICGLRWENVDLEAGLLSIREVRTEVGGSVVLKAPKTRTSARRLGIGGLRDLRRVLRQAWEHRRSDDPKEWVVLRRDGTPPDPDLLTRDLMMAVRRSGLPRITLHGLRHSFASVANSQGVPMFDISRTLGHSSLSVTSSIYTHLFDTTESRALAAVARAIEGGHEI